MNQPKTSYCRVTFYRSFFEGVYRVGNKLSDPRNGKSKEREVDEVDGVDGAETDDLEELPFIRTQISVKVLVFTHFYSLLRLNDE